MRRTVDFKRKQKVIVVDDKYEHASGVRELVNLENDYEVIANAGNANVATASGRAKLGGRLVCQCWHQVS